MTLHQAEDKSSIIMIKSTDWMMSFIGKKLSKRNQHKGKISPSSRMLRTISIHHLECSDYVLSNEVGQMATDIENPIVTFDGDSSAISQHELLVSKETQDPVNEKPSEVFNVIDKADDFPVSNYELEKIENHFLDEHLVLKGKLFEARDALLKQKDNNFMVKANDFAIQSKIFLDALLLFNANREAHFDIPAGQSNSSLDCVEILQSPAEARVLIKSASCPEFLLNSTGFLFSCHKKGESQPFVTQMTKSKSTTSFINISRISSDFSGLSGSYELRKRREAGNVVNRLRNLKQRIKDVIMVNRKEKQRISRDGILHRVPFGNKLSEDMDDKQQTLTDDLISGRCIGHGEGSELNTFLHDSHRKHPHKSYQRSRSLSESLDRYSQLFETFSLDEKSGGPERPRSKSIREDGGFQKLSKNMGRMLSNTELRTFSFNKDVQSDAYRDLLKHIASESLGSERESFVWSKSTRTDSDLQQEKLPKKFGRLLSSPVLRSYSSFNEFLNNAEYLELTNTPKPEFPGGEIERCVDTQTTETISLPILEENDCEHEVGLESPIPSCVEEFIYSDKFVTPTRESIKDMVESQVTPVSMDDMTPSLIAEVMEEETDLVSRLETQTKNESDVKLGKPSFISYRDLYIMEDSISSAKDIVPNDLQPLCIGTDEQPQLSDQNNINCNERNLALSFTPVYKVYQLAREAYDITSFLSRVDPKEDILFKFVSNTLTKSGYGTLQQKTEFSSSEPDADLYGIPFVQQLLYDLINEVLLDIYENSTIPNPWLFHFHSKIRSKPEGNYLLRDVWDEISWHLHSLQGLDATLDDLMAISFAKNDGWLNLYREAEFVALNLERLIVDDLLDEAVMNFDGLAF